MSLSNTKDSPTSIVYYTNGNQNALRFHAVVSEDHEANTQITKYPVQTGFEISNHAIKKNRRVVIEGIITNTIIDGSRMVSTSITNNSKEMFEVLESLVQSSTVCEVYTNLGRYKPVVFTSFSTKQGVGRMDSMHFKMVGEEIQIAVNVSRSAPVELSFVEMSVPAKIEYLKKFDAVPFDYSARIYQARTLLGTDFKFDTPKSSGLDFKTTFICRGFNQQDSTYKYEVHKEVEDLYKNAANIVLPESIVSDPFSLLTTGGFFSSCLTGKLQADIKEEFDGYVKTGMGFLKETVHGALLESTSLGGKSAVSQALTGAVLDCVSIELTQAVSSTDNLLGQAVTESDQFLSDGIASIGSMAQVGLDKFPTTEVTVTKIESSVKGGLSQLGETFT